MDFRPIGGVDYRHDYSKIFAKIAGQSRAKRIAVYRKLVQTDTWFLLHFVMGLKWLNKDFKTASWWVDRCNEVQDGPATDTVDCWFRESGKSTILTAGEVIQDILKDPNERIAIMCYNRPLAKAFLRVVKQVFEGNDLLKVWFPEILYEKPKTQAPKWSEDDGLIVKRSGAPKESTLEAWGLVDSQPTGRHFTKLVFDDCVTKESVRTPGMLSKTLEGFQMAQNIVSEAEKPSRQRIIGTRYDHADIYGWIIEQVKDGVEEFKDFVVRIWPGHEPGPDGEEVYQLFGEEHFTARRAKMGSAVYAAQILQDPNDPSKQFFTRDKVRYWTKLPEEAEDWPAYLLCDLAGWDELGAAAAGDNTAMLVVKIGSNGEWYVVETVIDRMTPTKMIEEIFRLYRAWGWIMCGIEDEKYGKMLRHSLDIEMAARGENLRIEPLKHGGRSKALRIEALQPVWERGGILVHPEQEQLIDEFFRYPAWARKDAIDALAYLPDMLPATPRRRRRGRRVSTSTGKNKRGGF